MLSLLPLLLAGPAHAQDDLPEGPSRVFVSEFQAANKEAASLAALLSGYLQSVLSETQGLQAIPVSAAPDFGEHSALVYLLSCPPGEFLGCAYVVGDRVDARYAVAGTVEARTSGSLVHITIIDVWDSREALSFDAELGLGDDEAFAEGVAEILVAVIEGREGRHEDIREFEDPDAADQAQRDAELAGQQLAALAAEIGDVTTLTSRGGAGIQRPGYTLEDLTKDSNTDAAKPWELVGMTPGEYIKYKNSGLTVTSWRDLSAGRRMQVFVRAGGGYGQGPWDETYRGWYTIDETFVVQEARAWQIRTSSGGGHGGVWVGFGLHPMVEVDVGAGVQTGQFHMHIQKEVIGDEPIVRDGTDHVAPNWWFGARGLLAPMPASKARPVIGAGFQYMLGESTEANLRPGAGTGLPGFDGNHLAIVQALPGGEVSLSELLDVYLMVPVSFVIGGSPQRSWEGEALTPGSLVTYEDPGTSPSLGASFELGFTLRFGGSPKPVETQRDEFEDLP
ncbi:MAG: hypothetical protein GY884_32410 [Proteobacteria bacterium]|nr:hypothetical protein [Pseudomonadota bacterium]